MSKEIGDRLKDLRIKLGQSQSYVAKETGINRSTLANYEAGDSEPKAAQLDKLAEFYNVSTSYILYGTRTVKDVFGVKSPATTRLMSTVRNMSENKIELLVKIAEDIKDYKE